ncbi:nitroreductase [Chromobacterium sp. ATCC 53434]|uniref:nitroreductase family protein n=1 Tax=Chromobacterium sp. (strain ATCC 53434 / SC 14030) TaxID=2059672 RepID=UPI000C774AF4|nr:nitroreductase [Chromobacterium sp. ATCC 53434]AUH49395.1 nitroreductase [Chromobacterium sp. ATCC 53434]
MSLVNTILQRKSQPLIDGEIPPSDLQDIFQCALTAPDHKRLRPWRFIVCHPEHKAMLIELIASSRPEDSGLSAASYRDKAERKLLATPHIVICLLDVNRTAPVPEIEQVLSAGASIQNMVVAAEALGYHCFWRTGEWAYNPALREKLGLGEHTLITGFLGLGRQLDPEKRAAPVSRPPLEKHFSRLDKHLAPAG